ncbi:Uncharacterized protein dnm_087170 [Desulfonema magnum]|uniref:Uncharacterized protein n=1 Tax=Desulfonema magnum TaxID=45655 RepID=A0A975BVL5_9BACT|nr:Uncharacterized protein dnm_087170 [Desulfonema magnum]
MLSVEKNVKLSCCIATDRSWAFINRQQRPHQGGTKNFFDLLTVAFPGPDGKEQATPFSRRRKMFFYKSEIPYN